MNHLKTHQTNPTTAQYRPVQSNTSTAQYSQVQPIPEPDPKPELFGQTRPEPDPKSKSPTRQTLFRTWRLEHFSSHFYNLGIHLLCLTTKSQEIFVTLQGPSKTHKIKIPAHNLWLSDQPKLCLQVLPRGQCPPQILPVVEAKIYNEF